MGDVLDGLIASQEVAKHQESYAIERRTPWCRWAQLQRFFVAKACWVGVDPMCR